MRDLTPHSQSLYYPAITTARALVAAACWCGTAALAQTTLFNPALGLPTAQGWLTVQNAPVAPGIVTSFASSLQLDTSANLGTQHGWARSSPTPLDTAAGFTLAFTLRMDADTTSSANRAGFSVLFVGADPAHSLELGFGSGSVFAYNYLAGDPERFVRGPTAGFNAGVTHNFALQVAGQQFGLLIDGAPTIAGALQNYQPDGLPYTLANFIFFGDNTTRASSNAAMGQFSLVSAVPEPATTVMWFVGLAGLGLVAGQRRRHSRFNAPT